eukprot:8244598-Pyramimonas_sp.AAC.1
MSPGPPRRHAKQKFLTVSLRARSTLGYRNPPSGVHAAADIDPSSSEPQPVSQKSDLRGQGPH